MKFTTSLGKALGGVTTALVLALGALLPVSMAHAAPAAGTVIGNQASATYTDGSGTGRSTTSNLVQTTVSQVKSFTLTADGTRTAAPGQTVYYPHTITNQGNGVDTYTLVAPTTGGAFAHTGLAYYADANGDGIPDNSVALTSTGPLAAGAQFRFVLAAVVPAGATLNSTGTLAVKATDTSATTATNNDTTTVSTSAVTVTKALSSTSGASPAGPLTLTLAYTNSGTSAASNLTIGDLLPTGMTYVAGSARWSQSGATALADTGIGNPSGIAYDYNVTTAGKVTAVIASVGAGTSGQLTFQVNIAGGLSPTNAALGASCTTAGCQALTTNVATFTTSTQASANTNSVLYTVVQSSGVVLNGSGASNVNGTNEPVTVATASQGAVVSFTVYAWNLSNGPDTLNMTVAAGTFPAGTTFQFYKADGTTPLLDTNGDGIPDTGPMAAAAVQAVVVKATLPTTGATGNNGGAGFTATVTATSVAAPTISDPAIIKLSAIGANTVDLTADLPVATATAANGLGSTGATVVSTNTVAPAQSATTNSVFKLFVNNTGAAVDSYDLSLTTALPAGWSASFRADGGAGNCSSTGAALTNTGSVAGGTNKLVCLLVTVPSIVSGNATAGNTDMVVKAQSASTAASTDTVGLRVTVQTVHLVTLSPNGQQQTYAGSAVTYVHVITNIGNGSETVTFAAGYLTDSQQAAGWTSNAYLDSNGNGVLDVGTDALIAAGTTITLLPGQSNTVFVRVFAPASATSASPADLATLTATYTTTVSATDKTGITDGLLLLKEQTLTGCAVTPAPASYSNAAIAAGPGTAPGQCLSYRITATNTTAASLTGVQLSDVVPANTTLNTGCGAPTGSAGVTMGGTATNGNTGTITGSIPSLAPNASITATFCVRINP